MFDLKLIRENPETFDSGWSRRGLAAQTPKILEMDEKRRAAMTESQALLAKRNEASSKIGAMKAKGEDTAAIMKEVAGYKDQIAKLEEADKAAQSELDKVLAILPNIPDKSVPEGKSADDNVEVRRIGQPKGLNNPKDHVDLGAQLGGMDFEAAAKMSGARFVLLRSGVARLERALAQFMLDTHTQEHGYTELSVPLLVKDEALYGTGQLPKFADDLFKTGNGLWMIPTSEVSLTNTVLDTILNADELPLRLTALTPCFRSEAGAAGKDTRGMIRQHQFYKVELVSITDEESSMAELERMTGCAEAILKKLDLPFRTLALCTGDMGFSAKKTFDIEVFLPGQNAYREISSCSNCGDFQARRMMTRYKREGDKATKYVHTLNGSGVAVGRCLVAVLENYQQPDGSVVIPDALLPYMGGIKKLEPVAKLKQGKVANA
ncbi:MAG TPA: serine--tRNA ligase [Patescibacteria group bacterium]|nr:serine--tRNA ligase [Patescibacteria group bacterium]